MELLIIIIAIVLFILGCFTIVKIVDFIDTKYKLPSLLCLLFLTGLAMIYGAWFFPFIIYLLELVK